jgi:hypothetical protein
VSWLVACDEPGCCEVGRVTRTKSSFAFDLGDGNGFGAMAEIPGGWAITRHARTSRPGDDGLPEHACPEHAAQRDFDEMEAKGR